ncbi:MAG TPA: Gldg family protein, partial [Ferruginibacter sp.]|nr:Gldg family protein [Ferruginibacter sp.]
MSRSKQFLGGKSWLIALLLVLVAINWAASRWHARLDFTNEKRFTISAPTQKLLRKLDQPVTIDVLLKGNYPSAFRQLAGSTDDMLREFREYAGNKIQFRFVAPDENMAGQTSTYADTLSAMGVFPINLTTQLKEGQQQQFVYPVALVQVGERLLPVMLYQGKSPMISIQELNSAEAMLEYNLANGIAKITEKDKPLVAYAIGNDEPGDYSTYDLFENTLKPNYRFFSFNLMTQPVIPSDFKALLVVKPALAFTDEEILKLDQYVMRGGKLLFFVDRLNAEMDSLRIKNEVIAYDRGLELNELLFRYGVRINPDLVMDLQCDYLPFDVNGNGQYEF